jgi:hypothetical protein
MTLRDREHVDDVPLRDPDAGIGFRIPPEGASELSTAKADQPAFNEADHVPSGELLPVAQRPFCTRWRALRWRRLSRKLLCQRWIGPHSDRFLDVARNRAFKRHGKGQRILTRYVGGQYRSDRIAGHLNRPLPTRPIRTPDRLAEGFLRGHNHPPARRSRREGEHQGQWTRLTYHGQQVRENARQDERFSDERRSRAVYSTPIRSAMGPPITSAEQRHELRRAAISPGLSRRWLRSEVRDHARRWCRPLHCTHHPCCIGSSGSSTCTLPCTEWRSPTRQR